MAADLNLTLNGTPVPVYLGENTTLALAQASRAEAAADAAASSASAAELARDQAADLVLPENIFVAADLATATANGEAAVTEGTYFKAVGQAEGLAEVRVRTSSDSDLLYAEITKARLNSTEGGNEVGLSTGRTVEEKLLDFHTVEDYGAVGDGVTDDSAAIQAAIDDTDGHLWFRGGKTYIAEGLVPHDNLTLCGSATIRPPVSQTDHVIHYNSATTLYNFNIEGLTFIGRGTSTYDAIHITSPAPAAVDQNWNESTLSRLNISQFRNGIFCPTPRSVRIRDCYIWANANGVAWDWEHFYIDHCTVMYNEVGLYVGHGSPVGTGIHHFRIIGTPIAHNSVAGIKGNMSSGSIIACSLIDNGSDPDTAEGHGHIVCEGVMLNMRILANRFEMGAATPYAIICVASGAVAERNLIQANTFLLNATADIYGSFARCSIIGNLSRSSGGSFYINTGNSTQDMIFTGNQVNDCAEEAMILSGTMIGMTITGNAFTDIGTSGAAGTYSGIRVASGASLLQASISENVFRNTGATKYMEHAVDLADAGTLLSVKVMNNTCRNLNATSIGTTSTALSDGVVIISGNDGTISENTGTATISSGNTFVDVSHGLAYAVSATRVTVNPVTPVAYGISIPGGSTTQFRISIASPAGSDITFNWSARLRK